jgi:hypothetical protein
MIMTNNSVPKNPTDSQGAIIAEWLAVVDDTLAALTAWRQQLDMGPMSKPSQQQVTEYLDGQYAAKNKMEHLCGEMERSEISELERVMADGKFALWIASTVVKDAGFPDLESFLSHLDDDYPQQAGELFRLLSLIG